MQKAAFGLFFLLVSLIPTLSTASEYQVFTKDLAAPYGHFKRALSLTSKKDDAAKAKEAITSFVAGWDKLAAKYGKDVPSVFSATENFPVLIARPVEIGRNAAALMEKGEIAAAHKALEEVRYLMWNLRVRNGIVDLADKANNFHEAMEIILDKAAEAKDPAALRSIEERFGAWLAVAWEEVALAPVVPEKASAMVVTMAEGRTAIAGLRTALQTGDKAGLKSQGTAVKNAYKKIFFMD